MAKGKLLRSERPAPATAAMRVQAVEIADMFYADQITQLSALDEPGPRGLPHPRRLLQRDDFTVARTLEEGHWLVREAVQWLQARNLIEVVKQKRCVWLILRLDRLGQGETPWKRYREV